MAANVALSNRPYFGKIAIETYGISLFGQPITWLTGTDGTNVSGMDYFYVDSSYLQVLSKIWNNNAYCAVCGNDGSTML